MKKPKTKLKPPVVDFYQQRVERAVNTAEAVLLRYEITTAVDNYCEYFARRGLQVMISWAQNTNLPDNPANIIKFTTWDDARNRRNTEGDGDGDGGKAA